jgi:hypothetical protein
MNQIFNAIKDTVGLTTQVATKETVQTLENVGTVLKGMLNTPFNKNLGKSSSIKPHSWGGGYQERQISVNTTDNTLRWIGKGKGVVDEEEIINICSPQFRVLGMYQKIKDKRITDLTYTTYDGIGIQYQKKGNTETRYLWGEDSLLGFSATTSSKDITTLYTMLTNIKKSCPTVYN